MNISKPHLPVVFSKDKKDKKQSRSLHKHPFAIPVFTFMVLFFVSCAGFVVLNQQTIGASDSKVVRLYVDGRTQVIPTRAQTVGELLQRTGVELRDGDKAEPALDSPIIDQDFNINVYRARPVTIIDDKGQKISTKAIETDPTEIAKKVGVTVYPEDNVSMADPDDALRDGVIGSKVVIDRATPTNINLYGNNLPVRTHTKTVGDLLKEKGIKTLEGDTIQPSPDTPLTADTQVFITRYGKQVVSTEEAIPAPVEEVGDPDMVSGSTAVKEPGSPGRKVVTYEIELQNGKESSRRAIQEVVAAQPVKKVIAKGTKVIISNPSANVELGRKIATEMGYADQFSCIYQIFERESHWNHLAGNASGAYGIPQALPGSKMGAGWQTDPAVQIRWGIGYMKKYGGPCGAWQFWQLHHYY